MGTLTKGLMGREDFNIQTNTSATESFNRTSSTGGTVAIEKMPDIWDGTGLIYPAACKLGSGNYPLEADTTTGRVLQVALLTIADGTNVSTLSCTLANRWNADAIAATDNVAKGATTSYWTLDADGDQLQISASGLGGNVIAVLSSQIVRNASGESHLLVDAYMSGDDIVMDFRNVGELATIDTTSLVDTGSIYIVLTYITSA